MAYHKQIAVDPDTVETALSGDLGTQTPIGLSRILTKMVEASRSATVPLAVTLAVALSCSPATNRQPTRLAAPQADTTRPAVPTELGGPAEILTLGIKGEIIFRNIAQVRFDDTTSGVTVRSFLRRYSAKIVGGTPISRAYILQIPDPGATWEQYHAVIRAMRTEPGVAGVSIVSISEMRVNLRLPRDSAVGS